MQSQSTLKYLCSIFFGTLINSRPFSPVFLNLIYLTDSIIDSEPEPDKKKKARIDWLIKNTHEKVLEPLATVELAVFRNWDKGLNKEIEFGSKFFTITELYNILNEIKRELNKIVTQIL
jgi:hypothetical protein